MSSFFGSENHSPRARHSPLAKLVHKATDESLREPDWGQNLNICDMIVSIPNASREIISATRKRMAHRNPKVAMLALTVYRSIPFLLFGASLISYNFIFNREIDR